MKHRNVTNLLAIMAICLICFILLTACTKVYTPPASDKNARFVIENMESVEGLTFYYVKDGVSGSHYFIVSNTSGSSIAVSKY